MGGLWVILLIMQVSAEDDICHSTCYLIESRIRVVVHAHRGIIV